MRPSVRLAWLAAVLQLAGCATLNRGPAHPRPAPPPPKVARDAATEARTASALMLAETFQTMQQLPQASPAQQASIVGAAQHAYLDSPGGATQLRYALILATPGQPGRDPAKAENLLRQLVTGTDALSSSQRAVARLELAQLNQELNLKAQIRQLQSAADLANQASVTQTQQLQKVRDQNARLRRQLEQAQAKLDAVANIERNPTGAKTSARPPPQPRPGTPKP